MNNEKGSIIEQASLLFSQGQYELAKALYEKASKKYGEHLFKANIWLCTKRLAQLENGEETVKVPLPNFAASSASSPSSAETTSTSTLKATDNAFPLYLWVRSNGFEYK